MLQAGCSCARGAALRSCCAATATGAIATAAGSAVAWRVMRPAATVHVDTNDLGKAGLPTPRGRGAGANGAVRVVMVIIAMAPAAVAVCRRT